MSGVDDRRRSWRRFRAMTTTPAPPVAARYHRQVGHPQGGPAPPHRPRPLRRRREGVGHAARRVPAQRPRPRRRSPASTPARPRSCRASWRSTRGRTSTGSPARLPRDARRGAGWCRRRSRSPTCATSGDPVAIVDRRDPLPRRGRVRARSRSTTTRRRRSSTTRRAAADTENIVHAGWGLESNAMVAGAVHAALPRPRRGVRRRPRTSSSATSSRTATSAMPMETRGIVASYHQGRDELEIVCATQSVHETRNFFARYLQIPEGNVQRHRARRRRRLRPEDVRVPRGVRGRARVVPARPAGEVDRGPAREPAVGRSLPQRVRARADGRRRRRHHPGHHRRPHGRRRRLRGVPGGAWTRCCCPGPYKIPRYGFAHGDGLDQHHGQGAPTAGPWMFETTAREMAIDHVAARDRHRPGRAPPPQPARRRRPPVHLADRQRVPGDHPARDARAGARDPRLRRVPQGAGRGARRGPLPRRRHLLPTWSRRRWAATRSPPRPPRSRSTPAAASMAYLGTIVDAAQRRIPARFHHGMDVRDADITGLPPPRSRRRWSRAPPPCAAVSGRRLDRGARIPLCLRRGRPCRDGIALAYAASNRAEVRDDAAARLHFHGGRLGGEDIYHRRGFLVRANARARWGATPSPPRRHSQTSGMPSVVTKSARLWIRRSDASSAIPSCGMDVRDEKSVELGWEPGRDSRAAIQASIVASASAMRNGVRPTPRTLTRLAAVAVLMQGEWPRAPPGPATSCDKKSHSLVAPHQVAGMVFSCTARRPGGSRIALSVKPGTER